MNIYYVYQYLREDMTPYYIGKGSGNRAYSNIRATPKPTDKSRIQIVAHRLSNFEASQLEIKLIALYGRKDIGTGILRNKTDGGDGATGHVHSIETKQKMSQSHKGKVKTPEHIKNMSNAKRGKPVSEAVRNLLAQTSKNRTYKPLSEETKRKISESKRLRKITSPLLK